MLIIIIIINEFLKQLHMMYTVIMCERYIFVP